MAAMDTTIDWQTSCHELKDRGEHLLKSGKWADCHFLVGAEPNQIMLPAHKLIMSMASPVFDAMFNGGLPEKNDPIEILDVQPEAFKALMEYIYTDKISINSVDKAFDLCYVAKKYMIPYVVEFCTKFLWSDLCPKNVCRAFEFANLFEEPRLAERCLQIICSKTMDILSDASFEDIELSTLLTILDQEYLHIDSELDLFNAMAHYADKHDYRKPITKEEEDQPNNAGEGTSTSQQPEEMLNSGDDRYQTFREAIRKIRFLTLTPKQFAENVVRTNILNQSEAFAILMNISSPTHDICPMPDGFSISSKPRTYEPCLAVVPPQDVVRVQPFYGFSEEQIVLREPTSSRNALERNVMETRKFYATRTIRQHESIDYFNTSVSDCSLTFMVDRSICITGIQVPTQVLGDQICHAGLIPDRYSELLYAHLLDSQGSRLTYTHSSSRVRFDSLLEISFDRPIYIIRNKVYKIGVAFNKSGWYPMCTCVPLITCENVCFTFNVGSPNESVRDGLIRAIVFQLTRVN